MGVSQPPAGRTIRASRPIAAAPHDLAAFLADLANHFALCEELVEIESLDGPPGASTRASVLVKGPLGVRRRARTRLLGITVAHVRGLAELDSGSQLRISWRLAPNRGTTTVTVELELREAHLLDGFLFTLGRHWLTAQLGRSLERLARAAASAAEQIEPHALFLAPFPSIPKESP